MNLETVRAKLDAILNDMVSLDSKETEDRILALITEIDMFFNEQALYEAEANAPVAQADSAPAF